MASSGIMFDSLHRNKHNLIPSRFCFPILSGKHNWTNNHTCFKFQIVLRIFEEKKVPLPDLPISKSTPCRALYFLKRAKSNPSKLLPARRKTSDRGSIRNFALNLDRLWTAIHNFSPLCTTGFVNKPI